jgi:transcriptional regulator with XRE-family HTH domain
MDQKQSFAEEVRAWRKSRNFLQKQAAEFLGIPLDTYRTWEHDRGEPHDSPSKGEIRSRMGSV